MAYLSYGSTGANVRQLQQQLKDAGYNVGNVDGIFGAKTQAALKAFQQKSGIGVDGIYGSQSANALQKMGHPQQGQLPPSVNTGPYQPRNAGTAPSTPQTPSNFDFNQWGSQLNNSLGGALNQAMGNFTNQFGSQFGDMFNQFGKSYTDSFNQLGQYLKQIADTQTQYMKQFQDYMNGQHNNQNYINHQSSMTNQSIGMPGVVQSQSPIAGTPNIQQPPQPSNTNQLNNLASQQSSQLWKGYGDQFKQRTPIGSY